MKKTWIALLIVLCMLLQAACAATPQPEQTQAGTNASTNEESETLGGTEDAGSDDSGAVETVPQDGLVNSGGNSNVNNDTGTGSDDSGSELPDDTYEDSDVVTDQDNNNIETIPPEGDLDDAETPSATRPPVADTPVSTQPAATEPKEETVASDVAKPLTWADINAIPIANSSMSTDQLRKIVTDFMRMQLSFGWTPSKNLTYKVAKNEVKLNAGSAYGGLPYVSSTFGNLYNIMEFYNEQTGVVNVSAGKGDILKIIGNQCSASAYWAWSRVSNTVSYCGTSDMMEKNGCLRVGNYTYSSSIKDFHTNSIRTANICKQNGEQVMYEAYAQLLPADGMSMYVGTAGHVRMVAEAAYVVRNADGTINPDRSCITYLDQVDTWTVSTQSNGKVLRTQGGVDVTASFRSLYNAGYLPFRIAELAGTDSVEKASASISYTGATASASSLRSSKLTANYPISDITVTVKNGSGSAIYRDTYFVCDLNVYECSLSSAVKTNALATYADGNYTVEISCRVGTGEKLVAYSGKLTK